MRPHEAAIDPVHGNDWRIVYLYAPHDLLSLPDAAAHPYELKGFTMWRAVGKMRDGDPGKGGKIKTMLASDRQTPSPGLS